MSWLEAGACPGQEFDPKSTHHLLWVLTQLLHSYRNKNSTWWQVVPGRLSQVQGPRAPLLLLHSQSEELCVRSKPRVKCRSRGRKWIWTNSSFLIFFLWYLSLAGKSLFSGAVIQSIILYHTIKIFRVFADLCSLKLNSLGWCENSAQLFTKSDSCFWYFSTSSVLTWMSWN